MKYYSYRQNNSGGSFIVDDYVAHNVIVQAESPQQADTIAESKGVYFNGCESGLDCECCGDRWHPTYEGDATDTPLVYGKEPKEAIKDGWFNDECVIYHSDGKVERVTNER